MQHGIPSDLALAAPGLTGDVVKWLVDTAVRPQPALALGAALALVGALKAHRVQTETGLRTNLLIANVALSGTGKNRPIEGAKQLLEWSSLHPILMGKPGSNAGLMSDLIKKQGRGLLLWDELGLALKAMSHSKADNYQAGIISLLTELFSCANSRYTGTSYSDAAKRDIGAIDQPCLALCGATTPKALFSAMSSSLVENGFVARFLFFSPTSVDVARQVPAIASPPTSIISQMQEIQGWRTSSGTGAIQALVPNPPIIRCDLTCRPILADMQRYFDEQLSATLDDDLRAVWARGEEHALKVALTCTEGPAIKAETLAWSFQLIKKSLEYIIYQLAGSVSDSKTEADTKKMLDIIDKAGPGGLSRSELTRKTQWLTGAQRADLVDTLIDSHQLIPVQIRSSTNTSTQFVSRAAAESSMDSLSLE